MISPEDVKIWIKGQGMFTVEEVLQKQDLPGFRNLADKLKEGSGLTAPELLLNKSTPAFIDNLYLSPGVLVGVSVDQINADRGSSEVYIESLFAGRAGIPGLSEQMVADGVSFLRLDLPMVGEDGVIDGDYALRSLRKKGGVDETTGRLFEKYQQKVADEMDLVRGMLMKIRGIEHMKDYFGCLKARYSEHLG